MAEVGLPLQATRERAAAREGFLSPGRIVGLVVFVLFSLTFVRAEVDDDGLYYYYFLRKLFGVHTVAEAYQFGSVFWTAPFWLASQLVAVRGQFGHYHAGEVGVTVASNAAVVATVYLGWRILRELELPRGAAVLMLTVFGTPLWYYAVSSPSYKHAADTLYCTAAFWFLLRATRDPRRRYLVPAGICLGLLLATRYVNVALLAGVLAMFAPRRWRRGLGWLVAATALTTAFLYLLPVARGIPYQRPADLPFNTTQVGMDGPPLTINSASVRVAAGASAVSVVTEHIHVDLLAPYRMLFTLHRGLFIWTPVTAGALAGFVLLFRRDRRNRRFLLAVAVSSFALLELHMLYGNGLWDGGGAFSSRFLTALFPLYVLGVAELVRRWRWRAIALLSACAVWSVWIGLVLLNGYRGTGGSVVDVVRNYTGPWNYTPHDSFGNFGHEMRLRISHRWTVLWHDLSY